MLLLLDLFSSFNIFYDYWSVVQDIYWHTIHLIIYAISFSCCSLFVLRLVFIVGLATRYCLTSLSSARKTSNVLKNSPSRPPTKGNTKLHTFISVCVTKYLLCICIHICMYIHPSKMFGTLYLIDPVLSFTLLNYRFSYVLYKKIT